MRSTNTNTSNINDLRNGLKCIRAVDANLILSSSILTAYTSLGNKVVVPIPTNSVLAIPMP